jgi:hypothetical protein
LLLLAPLACAQEAPATAKGTAIGQTINAAITAALPGVSAIENILATLFKKPTDPNSTASTKVTAQSVTNAVNSATATLQSNAQAQLSALQGAIGEISAANALAAAAQVANTSLPSKALLSLTGGMDTFKTQWSVAKTNINKLTSFDSAKLGKISDEAVQDAWRALNDSYTQWISDVDTNIANQTSVTTATYTIGIPSFDSLAKSIQDLTRIPSVELQLLAAQLKTVNAQAAPGPGAAPPPPPPPPPPVSVLNNANSLGGFIRSTVGK